jgi:hypothetical protein
MLRVIQHFGKHCSCHLQGVCLLAEYCGRGLYIGQAVGGECDVKNLIGVEGLAAVQMVMSSISSTKGSKFLRAHGEENLQEFPVHIYHKDGNYRVR